MPPTFAEWTERLKVYNEYIKSLGEHKLAVAKADRDHAIAAQEWQKARAMEIVIDQLDREMRNLNRLSYTIQRHIDQIERRQTLAGALLAGRSIPSNSFTSGWAAYEWFMVRAIIESPDDLFTIDISARAKSGTNFINIRDTAQQCDAVDSDLAIGLELADWLRSKRYMAKAGKPAQYVLSKVFKGINQIAEKTTGELRTRITNIRQNTYDTWKPSAIIGIPQIAAADRIENAGGRTS